MNPQMLQALMAMNGQGPSGPPQLPPGAGMQPPGMPMQPAGPQPIFQLGSGQFDLVQAIVDFNKKQMQEEVMKQQLSHQNDLESQQMSQDHAENAAEDERMHQIGMNRLQHAQASENNGMAARMKMMNL